MNYRGSGSSLQSHTRTNNEGRHNEEWSSVALCHPRKSVQFSRVRVREYETVRSARNNDDLTSSCPAVGLGWRYNPKETVSSLTTTQGGNNVRGDRGGGTEDKEGNGGSVNGAMDKLRLSGNDNAHGWDG